MASAKNNKFPDGYEGQDGAGGGDNRIDPERQIDPERLCDAAEAALKAVAEVSERNGGRWVYPADIMTAPFHPACLNGFTRFEIDQASRFLARMGIIEPKAAPRKAA